MERFKANKSIKCSVAQCEHHCDSEEYCSLDTVTIGTHETNPKMEQCTDCMSFRPKQ